MPGMTADEEERLLGAAAAGVSIRALAAEHGIGEAEVLALLDRAAEAWFCGEHLKRKLLLEVERLNALERHYYAKALGNGEGASTAAALFVKLAERKATLIGLNAPVATASVTIHQSVEATKVTSTERIRQALDQLRLHKPEAANGEVPPSED
jgi:hypothetical protein